MKVIKIAQIDGTRLIEEITRWHALRNASSESKIYSIDAEQAAAVGLPTLAALNRILDTVQRAHDYMSRTEVSALLRPVLNVAIGEASERVRIVLGDPLHGGVPGVAVIPRRLMEREK